MRTAKVLALGLMLTLVSAGCGGKRDDGTGVATAQNGAATASAGPTTKPTRDPDAPLKFAKCMREQGLTWFPDPDPNGGMAIKVPNGVDPKKMDAAHEACKQYAPGMDGDAKPDPQMLENMRQMAKCMRANGVPKFPDPEPGGGGIRIDGDKVGMGPGDPTFDKAEQKCSKYMPRPDGGSGPQTRSDGAGGART